MSSIARPSRSISVGIAEPSWMGRRSPAPNCSAAPMSRLSGRSTDRTVPNEVTAPTSSDARNSPHSTLRRLAACRCRSFARADARVVCARPSARTSPSSVSDGPRARSAMRRASSARPRSVRACAMPYATSICA